MHARRERERRLLKHVLRHHDLFAQFGSRFTVTSTDTLPSRTPWDTDDGAPDTYLQLLQDNEHVADAAVVTAITASEFSLYNAANMIYTAERGAVRASGPSRLARIVFGQLRARPDDMVYVVSASSLRLCEGHGLEPRCVPVVGNVTCRTESSHALQPQVEFYATNSVIDFGALQDGASCVLKPHNETVSMLLLFAGPRTGTLLSLGADGVRSCVLEVNVMDVHRTGTSLPDRPASPASALSLPSLRSDTTAASRAPPASPFASPDVPPRRAGVAFGSPMSPDSVVRWSVPRARLPVDAADTPSAPRGSGTARPSTPTADVAKR